MGILIYLIIGLLLVIIYVIFMIVLDYKLRTRTNTCISWDEDAIFGFIISAIVMVIVYPLLLIIWIWYAIKNKLC